MMRSQFNLGTLQIYPPKHTAMTTTVNISQISPPTK